MHQGLKLRKRRVRGEKSSDTVFWFLLLFLFCILPWLETEKRAHVLSWEGSVGTILSCASYLEKTGDREEAGGTQLGKISGSHPQLLSAQ
jgi:hypothetical protein